MRTAADQARAQGHRRLPADQRGPPLARYRDLLAAGLAAHPPPAARRRPGQRGRLAQSPARNLLERRLLRKDEVLAFLDDLTIPFDNNRAEWDLRGLKRPQKVPGCFRSDAGADAFAYLRTYLATLRKQGQALLAALQSVFAGQPLYPAFAWPATRALSLRAKQAWRPRASRHPWRSQRRKGCSHAIRCAQRSVDHQCRQTLSGRSIRGER